MLIEIIFFLILYSFIGWILEIIYCGFLQKRFINRGFLLGPVCPIYGFGALLIIYGLSAFRYNRFLLFILGMLSCTVIEYLTSYLLEKAFKTKWWDYSNYRFNLNGRVCLVNSLIFGILTLVATYFFHPFMLSLYNMINVTFITIITITLLITLILDFTVTIISLIKVNNSKANLTFNEKVILMKTNYDNHKSTYWEKYVVKHLSNSFPLVVK